MNGLLKVLNRGPLFRAGLVVRDWRQKRRFERWRRGVNATARVEPDVIITGNPDPLPWIHIGPGTEIQRHCRIWIGEKEQDEPRLTIGRAVFVGQGTHLSVMRPMVIGDNTLIGAYCYLVTNQHCFSDRKIPIRNQGYTSEPLSIAEDVWIGAASTIMPGVTIQKGAVIGANSVVTKDVGPYEIWAGVPAKKIGDRP